MCVITQQKNSHPFWGSLIYKITFSLLLLLLLLLLVALTWADALSPYFFAGSLFFSLSWTDALCPFFFPRQQQQQLSWTDALCPFFFPKTTTTTCICINRSSNHGTIMWLLYEPTIITNLLYFLIKCIPGRVRSGRSEVRICTQIRRWGDRLRWQTIAHPNLCANQLPFADRQIT